MFIRHQVEPEIVAERDCIWDLYGPTKCVRAYADGYGDFFDIEVEGGFFVEDADAYRVSLIGA